MFKRSWLFVLLSLSCSAEENKPAVTQPVFTAITCATSDIGKTIAAHFAEKNMPLLLVGRNQEKLGTLAAELKTKYKSTVKTYPADFSSQQSMDSLSSSLKELKIKVKRIVLITPRPEFPTELLPKTEQIMEMVKVCFAGPLQVLKYIKPSLEINAKIVIISGASSKEILPTHPYLGVIRNMWAAQAQALSHRWGQDGVQINTVSPGMVLTTSRRQEISRKAEQNKSTYDEQLKEDTQHIPLKKYATPEEVANVVDFLLSDNNSHISGVNLLLDGGNHKSY